jgi:RNA polymerase sigma factor (sigma-70 family)
VEEDAVQVGRMAFWRSVVKWDPEVAPLTVWAWRAIERAVWEEAARMGGGAVAHYGDKAPRVECLDAPVGDDADSVAFVDLLPAESTDVSIGPDVRRLLAQLSEREADVLWRVASDEKYEDIAEDYGVTRQRVQQMHAGAKERARRIAEGMIRRVA